jgi:SAM-dependent methyltransferase
MNLVPEDQTAIYQTPASWNESFDLVTSFFVLEHVHELRKTLEHIYALVADGGYFYGVVPDTFGNVADFIVVDHVNHFTQPSLHIALAQVGFGDITIDATLHRGALTFHARKSGGAVDKPLHSHFIAESRKIAEYWKNLRMNLRAREKNTKGLAAIYGSGFYGAYILTNLQDASRVEYFVDSSRFQQGKNVLNKPVFAPNALMANTQVMYVGLNPVIARQVMETMTSIFDANIECVFLDETQS